MPRPRLPECVVAGETGMVSLLSLLAVLGLLVLFGLLANVGRTANQKVEVQNGADAVAYSGGNQLARGMNTVTAVNHLIGELSAFVILHHGFGGDPLVGRGQAPTTPNAERVLLPASYQLAVVASRLGGFPEPNKDGYEKVRDKPDDDARDVGGALWDSRIRLKHIAVWSYTIHAIGGFLSAVAQYIPVFGPIIKGVLTVLFIAPAIVFEYKAYQEALVLNALEQGAKALKPVRQVVERAIIPGLRYYTVAVYWNTPRVAEVAAEEVGNRGLVEGKLFPGFLKNPSWPLLALPLTPEGERPTVPVRSQLLRATTPWVQYWRVPWLRFGEDALLLARFKPHYWDRTDEYSLTLTDRFRREGGVLLYHLNGYDPDREEKGSEEWQTADGSRQADRQFAVVGFGHRGRAETASYGVFRQANPHGIAAYAQAFVYNANPNPRTTGGGLQPRVAYDTLNWVSPVFDHPGQRPVDTDRYSPIPNVAEPRVRVNWQVKLVPATRVADSIWFQRGELGEVMRRTAPFHLGMTGTH
ncbi:MAG: pilus assembly protein TadG-related protein [Fimbriiglobus sp.]|jgi:hypothetical protein|nr:pilus assembly protein TadG-related protein [Fimbriiglobus sp.]